MSKDQIVGLRRTVYINKETEDFCSCQGDFYKVCPLRVSQDLPCFEAVVKVIPVKRQDPTFDADEATRSLDASLKNLKSSLKGLSDKFKI